MIKNLTYKNIFDTYYDIYKHRLKSKFNQSLNIYWLIMTGPGSKGGIC